MPAGISEALMRWTMFQGMMEKINRKLNGYGQSLAETAITLPILIMIVSGLVDIGRLFFIYIALEDAAGEAALYTSINPQCWTSIGTPSKCANPNNAIWRAQNAGTGFVNWNNVNITLDPAFVAGSPHPIGTNVSVVISYDVQLLTPFVQGIAAVNPITLTAGATSTVIVDY